MRQGRSLAWVFALSGLVLFLGAAQASAQAPEADHPVQALPIKSMEAIDQVWSGHKVGFALVAGPKRIYAGYYDANRQLTIAQRDRAGSAWTYVKLDTWLGWDSHNYVAMGIDPAGQLHVMANMHSEPLIYYRTTGTDDARDLRRRLNMIAPDDEARVTYPVFLHDADGRLVVKYRSGRSGSGDEIYNLFDPATDTWRRLLGAPLASGEGRRNAYFVGPVLGPDKMFHIVWVWRDSPDAATNHDLSYARSRDLIHWERSDGVPLALPITLGQAEIVDPVPVRGGMINNNTVLGFDAAGRPIVAYHKFDSAGDTQIYLARREAAGWRTAKVSRWKGFRWDFGGAGSLAGRVQVGAVRPSGAGRLVVPVVRDGRSLELVVDEASLAFVEERPVASLADQMAAKYPASAGMGFNVLPLSIGLAENYALAWATRPPNRDRPTEDIPAPTTLRLVELQAPLP